VRVEVGENRFNELPVFESGDDSYRTATAGSGLDTDTEQPLDSLGPSHCSTPFGRCWFLRIVHRTLNTSAPFGRRDASVAFVAGRTKSPRVNWYRRRLARRVNGKMSAIKIKPRCPSS